MPWTEIRPPAFPLFDGTDVGHLATINADGSPHSTPVWVERDGGTPLVSSVEGRTKVRNLRRDPRAVLTVHSASDPYFWAQVRGRARLEVEGAEEQIHRLSRRYLGEAYPWADELGRRVTIRIVPEVVRCAVRRPRS